MAERARRVGDDGGGRFGRGLEFPEPYAGPSIEDVRQLVFDGRYREAEEAARELLPEVESESGSASLETAAVLDALAETLWRGGQCLVSPECAEVAERALILRQNRLGDDVLVADSLVRKAEVLVCRDDLEGAQSALLRALEIYESAAPQDSMRLARAHSRLADLSEAFDQVEGLGRALAEGTGDHRTGRAGGPSCSRRGAHQPRQLHLRCRSFNNLSS